jgi:hypothetical protein
MPEIIRIYHTDIQIPNKPTEIENWDTENPKEQYWRRRDLPSYFELVEYTKEGDVLLDEKQTGYARQEVRRCKEGFWFMNNGKGTYVTGLHYFYLVHWKIDVGYPDFRMTDLHFFWIR